MYMSELLFGQTLIIIILICCESLAQTCLNNGVTHKYKFLSKETFVVIGMIAYAVVGYVYYRYLKALSTDKNVTNALNTANSIWNAGIQITIALISWAVFGSKITLINWLGIGLMSIGLLMVV